MKKLFSLFFALLMCVTASADFTPPEGCKIVPASVAVETIRKEMVLYGANYYALERDPKRKLDHLC